MVVALGVCALVALVSVTVASSPPISGLGYPDPLFSHSGPFGLDSPPGPDTQEDVKLTKVVESFRVRSDIRYRFATTQMSSVVRNVAPNAQEIDFDVTLPKNAFIMDFYMTIDGKRYDGDVKERKEAKKQYQEAVDRGQSAGHVRQAPRHANVFEVSVNVAAGSAVNFTLTYQEVLRRRLGIYEHEIHVNPGQPVEDFLIEVYIRENRPLKFVRTPALRTDYLLTNKVDRASKQNEATVVNRPSPETATIQYQPTLSEQGDKEGVSARFAVQYDVEHAGPKGDVLVVDGYFVHFMVPDGLPQTLPKDIIFVLDVSGSMFGIKIQQLRIAMSTILKDLQPKDRFNIITFSSSTSKWREGLVPASEQNVGTAQTFVSTMQAAGMTNINAALLTALSELKNRQDKDRVGMIFFLTDGDPTEGVTDPDKIAKNVLNANERTVAIFTLAFGDGADYESLKSLSAQNLGFARKIYEASDADLQVSSLYDEISAVSIKDMSIKYQNSSVDEFSLTETEFPIVFNGTEIVVCGFLYNHTDVFAYEITGLESQGRLDITGNVNGTDTALIEPEEQQIDQLFTGPRDFSGMVQRMWAYQTIRQLLRQKQKYAGDTSKIKKLDDRILELSLKYKFVTPLTSMLVTKPDKGETEMKETDLEGLSLAEKTHMLRGAVGPRGSTFQNNPKTMQNLAGYNFYRHRSSNHMPGPALDPYAQFDPQPMMPMPALPTAHMPRVFSSTAVSTISTTTASSSQTPKSTTAPTSSTTLSTTRSTTTSRSTTSAQQSSPSAFLKLVTLSLDLDSLPPPVICMVPRKWKYGNIILLSEATNGSRVVLTQCSKRQCPTAPSIQSLRFKSGGASTEIQLDGRRVWQYTNSIAFHVSVMSNQELIVHGHGLSATIEKVEQGGSVGYKVKLILYVKRNPSSSYLGLLGELMSRPAQLQRWSKNYAQSVCKDEKSQYNISVYNRFARKHSVYRTRKRLLQ